jgi:hypothetical protein
MELRDRRPSGPIFAADVEIRRGEVAERSASIADQIRHSGPAGSPIASIVITCYNYGRLVEEAVHSALEQTLTDVEVIVVDDQSSDPVTIRALDELDPRVRVVRQKNTGAAMARNNGVALARGKYICCLDHDDTIEPSYLEKAVIVMESRPDIGLVYPYVHIFGDEDWVWGAGNFDPDTIVQMNPVGSASVYRRSVWAAAGGYSPAMPGYVDWEYWLRLASLGVNGWRLHEPLMNYRKHGWTMFHEAAENHARELACIRELNPEIFERDFRERLGQKTRPIDAERPFAWASQAAPITAGLPTLVVLVSRLEDREADLIYSATEGLTDLYDVRIVAIRGAEWDCQQRLRSVTRRIFNLSDLLKPSLHAEFLLSVLGTWGVESLLIAGCDWGYRMIDRIKQISPTVRIHDLFFEGCDDACVHLSASYERDLAWHVTTSEDVSAEILHHRIDATKVVTSGIGSTYRNLLMRPTA